MRYADLSGGRVGWRYPHLSPGSPSRTPFQLCLRSRTIPSRCVCVRGGRERVGGREGGKREREREYILMLIPALVCDTQVPIFASVVEAGELPPTGVCLDEAGQVEVVEHIAKVKTMCVYVLCMLCWMCTVCVCVKVHK